MNATEDGEPLGENPPIDTLTDTHARHAIEQLAQRQAQALNEIRRLHLMQRECASRGVYVDVCIICRATYPCATVRAIEAAGA